VDHARDPAVRAELVVAEQLTQTPGRAMTRTAPGISHERRVDADHGSTDANRRAVRRLQL
jgi:hypothetical protein